FTLRAMAGAVFFGLAALAAAAWGGAQWQAARSPVLDPARQQALDTRLDSATAALQGSMAELAGKVGELQGRVLAMDALRERVALAAGLSYSAPESLLPVTASGDDGAVMDDIPALPLPDPS